MTVSEQCWSMVAIVGIVHFQSAILSIRGALAVPGPRSKHPIGQRPSVFDSFYGTASELSAVGLIMLCWWRGWWTWSLVSPSSTHPITSTILGVISYLALRMAWKLLRNRVERALKFMEAKFLFPVVQTRTEVPKSIDYARDTHSYWPRRRIGRFFVASRLVISPVVEEFTTRGVLVAMVASTTGSLAIGLVLGVAACIILHVHQGVKSTLYHSCFFAFTAVLSIQFGLLSAIACHLLTDAAHIGTFHIKHVRALRAWERAVKPR